MQSASTIPEYLPLNRLAQRLGQYRRWKNISENGEIGGAVDRFKAFVCVAEAFRCAGR